MPGQLDSVKGSKNYIKDLEMKVEELGGKWRKLQYRMYAGHAAENVRGNGSGCLSGGDSRNVLKSLRIWPQYDG